MRSDSVGTTVESAAADAMSPEPITFAIGTAAAKALAQIWLKGDPVVPTLASEQINVLLDRRFASSWYERRRAKAFFTSMTEEVTDRLLKMLDREFAHVPDHERQAAVHAVASTVERGALSVTDVVAANAEPRELERRFHASSPDAARRERLSVDGEELYRTMLSAVCHQIAAVAVTLPDFNSEATRELLQRGDRILGLAREALDRIADTHDAVSRLAGDPSRFESRYLEHVAAVLDNMTLFGLGGGKPAHEYPLSIAYITLTSTRPRGRGQADAAGDGDDARVDEVLGSSPRTVVRGEAGSGKTTLLRWLAVTTARRGCAGALSPLSECVPFFIPLRQYVGKDLPHPPEFITPVAAPLRGRLPHGWVEDQLDSGRALVLVDGVDELPPDDRTRAQEWIRNICRAYGNARYVVTSRPPAVDDRWLASDGFVDTELQPMDEGDIYALIDHWHDAILKLQPGGVETERRIMGLRDEMRREILRSPAVRGLATSPLLCAVLCTLHRGSEGRLPSDRLELYRRSLDLLVEQRDAQRGVAADRYFALTLRQREVLLRDLAYWLLRNGHSDASREDAVEAIQHKLSQMPDVEVPAETLLRDLLERSGVLREPVAGRIDFVHRTFQEYLAADEAVQRNDIGVLLNHAGDDAWREVIVLAAGLAHDNQRARLIGGLLDSRGRRAARRKRRLLAVACLETAPTIHAEHQKRIAAAVDELMPPRSNLEARALAQASDRAVPLLEATAGSGVGTVRPSIRALTLIGSERALHALRRFGTDDRVSVIRELQRSWAFFDPDEYARCVLADSRLGGGTLLISSVRLVPALAHLKHLERLHADLSGSEVDLDTIGRIQRLERLRLRDSDALRDLAPLRGHSGLRRLEIQGCPRLWTLAGLAGTKLAEFSLVGPTEVSGLEPLADLPTLQSVVLVAARPLDLSPLFRHPGLVHLEVGWGDASAPLELDLADLPGLESLVLRHHAGLTALRGRSESIRSIDAGHTALERLDLGPCPRLERLIVSRTRLRSLDGLSDCDSLRDVELSNTPLTDLTPLERCDALRSVEVHRVNPVAVQRFHDARPAVELVGAAGSG